MNFEGPSSSTEIDGRRLQQLADLGQDISPLPISHVIRIVRKFDYGKHLRVRQTVFFNALLHYTSFQMSHYGQGSSFRRLRLIAKTHRHLTECTWKESVSSDWYQAFDCVNFSNTHNRTYRKIWSLLLKLNPTGLSC